MAPCRRTSTITSDTGQTSPLVSLVRLYWVDLRTNHPRQGNLHKPTWFCLCRIFPGHRGVLGGGLGHKKTPRGRCPRGVCLISRLDNLARSPPHTMWSSRCGQTLLATAGWPGAHRWHHHRHPQQHKSADPSPRTFGQDSRRPQPDKNRGQDRINSQVRRRTNPTGELTPRWGKIRATRMSRFLLCTRMSSSHSDHHTRGSEHYSRGFGGNFQVQRSNQGTHTVH